MNYIWLPLIEAIQVDYDIKKIRFRVKDREFHYHIGDEKIRHRARAHHMSPLLEYLPLILYDQDNLVKDDEKFSRIDINPYFRFSSIFNEILSPERNDPNDLIVCDIIVHILADIDRICGMSRRDFQVQLVMKDMDNGCYGGKKGEFDLFNTAEKRALAETLIMLYETSNGFRCLDVLFKMIMTDFKIRNRNKEEVVFYNPSVFNEKENEKLKVIIKLFLPLDFPYVVHWRHTYGTVDHDISMILEEFVL